MLFELSEQAKQNILVFLNRLEYKGLDEATAVNEILVSLANPINENIEEKEE
jgi:hypothetical protein